MSDLKSLRPCAPSPKGSRLRTATPPTVGWFSTWNPVTVLWVGILFWFLIIGAIVGVILGFTRPPIVQKQTSTGDPSGEADILKCFWGALILGLIAAVIYAFVKGRQLRGIRSV